MSLSTWGGSHTQFFFELSPEKILDAVERTGLQCTGRILQLASLENRVYEIEIEVEKPKTPADRFVVAKFYRPGRWTEAQILEEHAFLNELVAGEIPVIAPLKFQDGTTLNKVEGIWFCLFPKKGGRSPDELMDDDLIQVGRLLARIHLVGKAGSAKARLRLEPSVYGIESLRFLRDGGHIPADIQPKFTAVVERICTLSENGFKSVQTQRIHGDFHLGNILKSSTFFAVDFDDFVVGPVVQDFWLILPSLNERLQWEVFLEGYEQMIPFDRSSLRLVEPLRALRYLHFSAWIAKRWQDPIFPKFFPAFGTPGYWNTLLADLNEQLAKIKAV